MKKLLFVFSAVALLAAGCNSSPATDSQRAVQQPTSNAINSATQQSTTNQGNSTAPLNQGSFKCDDLISLNQMQDILIGSVDKTLPGNTILQTKNMPLDPTSPSSKGGRLVCEYRNVDISNLESFKGLKFLVTADIFVFDYVESAYNFNKSKTSDAQDVLGFGFQGYSSSKNSNYVIVSSNKKYMFNVIVIASNVGQSTDFKSSIDNAKQTQSAQAIIKIIDTNLNKY